MYKFMKAWTKKKCFTSFNNSNGEQGKLKEIHGFDTHGRKVQLRNQKHDEFNLTIDRDIQFNEFRKEIVHMIDLLSNETDLKLYNINESLKSIQQKIS